MSDYVKIKSISIDMSTEEAPYHRIYAKPIEKQGDVLLCEFENANYDIEQKALKEENTKLKEKYDQAIWWLKEIVTCHRHTPISTAEKALNELLGNKTDEYI